MWSGLKNQKFKLLINLLKLRDLFQIFYKFIYHYLFIATKWIFFSHNKIFIIETKLFCCINKKYSFPP